MIRNVTEIILLSVVLISIVLLSGCSVPQEQGSSCISKCDQLCDLAKSNNISSDGYNYAIYLNKTMGYLHNYSSISCTCPCALS